MILQNLFPTVNRGGTKLPGKLDGRRAEEGGQERVQKRHNLCHRKEPEEPCVPCSRNGGKGEVTGDVPVEDVAATAADIQLLRQDVGLERGEQSDRGGDLHHHATSTSSTPGSGR